MQETDFQYIQKLVEKTSGIVIEKGKEYLVELRLTALARKKNCDSIAGLVAALRSTSPPNGLQVEAVEAMTTNETLFFRDGQPFDALRTIVLPELIKHRASSRTLHFWCAASATGQEPYSVVMLLQEHFPELANWKIEWIASDLSTKALAYAQEGIYNSLEVARGLPPTLLEKYFEKRGPNWQIKDEIRRRVEFRQINLIQNWPALPPMDIVFIRNVMIYFDVTTRKTILAKLAELLQPDGFLFLGGVETTLNLSEAFERIPFQRSGCFRLAQPRKSHGS